MKKILCLLLAFAMLFSLAACGQKESPPLEPPVVDDQEPTEAPDIEPAPIGGDKIVGGWTMAEDTELTADGVAKLTKAFEDFDGQIIPVRYVASQVVAGTNHCYLVKVFENGDDAETYDALAYFYEDLQGEVKNMGLARLESDDISGIDVGALCLYQNAQDVAAAIGEAAESIGEEMNNLAGGNKKDPNKADEEKPAEKPVEEPAEDQTEENGGNDISELSPDEAWDKLESIGKIETESGIMYVKITIPAELCEDETQESIDAGAGNGYVSGKLNEDGSITYKMTKEQHREMLEELRKTVNEGLQEVINSGEFAISNVDHNGTFTHFDVYLTSETLGFYESYLSYGLVMYAGVFALFTGEEVDEVTVDFYNVDGDLVSHISSKDLA